MTGLAELTGLGLRWETSGQAGLTGPLLALADGCDRALRTIASRWHAREEAYPMTLPAASLGGHLRSFPHQVTFAAALDPADANLAGFADGPVVDASGAVALTRTAPVTEVLTPAACHHVYRAHRGERLAEATYVSTRNTCFRREREYEPLRRQWTFAMREIVCLGTAEETASFLAEACTMTDRFARLVDVPVDWVAATDPFFRPDRHPGHLLQRIQPVKHEAVYGGSLALGSANLHHDHFGSAYDITRGGAPAGTACLAFGLERWLYALVDRHGLDPAGWPDLDAAAMQAVAR
ncbi:hypothetical protein [Catellatospora methionotrophica]|uniref:hypothetical protein n=1 Tax=Catellatospora methionotrophica TaxID=121620 RepID=UPI0033CDCF4F